MRLLSVTALLLAAAPAVAQKEALAKSVDARAEASWALAKQIWDFAEGGYLEKRSSAALSEHLEKAGFKVERGVAGIPTAFVATFGSGKPVIGILGEYDAAGTVPGGGAVPPAAGRRHR
ncbi:MAG: hypothetical protein U0871_18350 [Gemmataceae bacterium]